MFGLRWPVVRLLGIPVFLDVSWLIILALLSLTLVGAFPVFMQDVFPESAPSYGPAVYWVMAPVAAVAFFICILLHELGHAAVARSRGMPIRGITLFLFGGVAEIGEEPRSPGIEFAVAIAGPIVTVFLAVTFGLLTWLGYGAGWPAPVIVVLGYLVFINTMLLVFNLIPAFPLDGGRVFRAILWKTTGSLRRATRWAAMTGQGFAFFLVLWGAMELFGGNLFGGLWMCLVGFFLRNAAQMSYSQVLMRQTLEGELVRRFMTPSPFIVSPSLDLRTFVEENVYRCQRKAFPVVLGETLVGYVDADMLARIPRSEWGHISVGDVMRRDLDGLCIEPDADAMAALDQMQRSGMGRLLVTDKGNLVGILSQNDLLRVLTLKLELEPEEVEKGGPGTAVRLGPPDMRKPNAMAHR